MRPEVESGVVCKRRYPEPCGIQCAKSAASAKTAVFPRSKALHTHFRAQDTALWPGSLNALRQLSQDSFQDSGIAQRSTNRRFNEHLVLLTMLCAPGWLNPPDTATRHFFLSCAEAHRSIPALDSCRLRGSRPSARAANSRRTSEML